MIFQRNFSIIIELQILLVLLLSTFSCSIKDRTTHQPPNVLFISVDDLNDWIGALQGHTQAITPNMDRLFEQGVLFTNAHCSQAVCTASRNSLMSGVHPSTSGWYGSTNDMRKTFDQVMDDHKMLPEYLKDHGYHTYAVGKIFHSGESDYPDKTDDFWTEWAPRFWNEMALHIQKTGFGYRGKMFYPFPKDGGQLVQLYGEDLINERYRETNRFYSLCGGPLADDEIPNRGMYDVQIADWAIDKLEEGVREPFFMAVGFVRPHVPYTAPQKYFDLYQQDEIILPDIPLDEMKDIPMMGKSIARGYTPRGGWGDVMQKENLLRELVHSYLACVSFVDDQIGRLVDAMEQSKQAKNTIVILWSDHGQHLGEKRHFRKQALWGESTKVPLYFKVPQDGKTGQCNKAVSLLDIYPTLVELCGLPTVHALEGNSLVPLIRDTNTEWDRPILSTWKYKNHAVRSNDWRYIQYRDGGEELYHPESDPGEHQNLVGDPQYAEVIEELRKWLPTTDALPPGTSEWEGDVIDERIEDWITNDSIPDWLK